MRTWTKGTELVFTTQFTDNVSKLPVNPGNVAFKLRDPNGVETSPTAANPETGTFTVSYTPAISGVWSFRWEGTGTVNAAREGMFEIRASDL